MMRVLFRPKNASSSGTSLGEMELDAYDDGVRGRLEDGLGDCRLSKIGWGTGSSSSIRAATTADHCGVGCILAVSRLGWDDAATLLAAVCRLVEAGFLEARVVGR